MLLRILLMCFCVSNSFAGFTPYNKTRDHDEAQFTKPWGAVVVESNEIEEKPIVFSKTISMNGFQVQSSGNQRTILIPFISGGGINRNILNNVVSYLNQENPSKLTMHASINKEYQSDSQHIVTQKVLVAFEDLLSKKLQSASLTLVPDIKPVVFTSDFTEFAGGSVDTVVEITYMTI